MFLAGRNDSRACGGLKIDDEIRVTIAGQACLLLLHREPACYPSLKTILVYPSSYLAKNPYDSDDKSHRLGESWQYGPVVLAWDSSRRGGKNAFDGHNVVAARVRPSTGPDGRSRRRRPTLGKGEDFDARKLKYRSWALVFSREFECFERKAARGKNGDRPLRGHQPGRVFCHRHRGVFRETAAVEKKDRAVQELRSYYKQDPANWARSKSG